MQLITFGFQLKTAQAVAEKLNTLITNPEDKVYVYDAAAWVDQEFALVEKDSSSDTLFMRDNSTRRQRFIRRKLSTQPYYGLDHFESWWAKAGKPKNILIVEPQTPDDFIGMIQGVEQNLVMRMDGLSKAATYPDALAEGRLWVEQYLLWRKRMGSEIPVLTCTEFELEEELAAKLGG